MDLLVKLCWSEGKTGGMKKVKLWEVNFVMSRGGTM
jgi:hypothetical protein